jgi:hypothetical protein
MMRVGVGVIPVLIALAGPLPAGCGEIRPYVQRDPAGPCIQRPSRKGPGKGYVATLWRGDMFVGNIQNNGQGLHAAVMGATTDNPAAQAEARIGQREHREAMAVIYGQWLGAIAVGLAGVYVTHGSSDRAATIPFGIGAFGADLAMLLGGIELDSAAHAHARKAIAIYNANPPPSCEASSPVIGREAP